MSVTAHESVVAVLAADDGYAMPLAVALRSAVERLDPARRLAATVIDGGVSAAQRERVERSLPAGRADVRWVAPPHELLDGARVQRGRISLATYYRILIAHALPETARRAIYLDCDVVVCADLGALFDLPLEGRVLLAVRDAAVQTLGSPLGLADCGALGLDPEAPYFNAGVALVDLERWRAERVADRVLHHVAEHGPELRFWDQDALNAVLAGRWGELEPRWNQIPQIHDYRSWAHDPFGAGACRAAVEAPQIVHYATWSKPWHWGCAHPERERFFEVLDRTAWAGWRPRKRLQDARLAREWSRVRRGLTRRAAALLRAPRAARGPSGR